MPFSRIHLLRRLFPRHFEKLEEAEEQFKRIVVSFKPNFTTTTDIKGILEASRRKLEKFQTIQQV